MSQPNDEPINDTNEPVGTSRRLFLKGGIAAAAAWTALSQVGCATTSGQGGPWPASPPMPREEVPGGQAEGQPAGEPAPEPQLPEVRLAFIGTGGMGGSHIEEVVKYGINCPCYCDVDTRRHAKAAEAFPKARAYQDYREMIEKEHKNFDGVMIGMPDHQHYPATILAMQHGKHVYTQKPLTHTIWEARQLAEAARKYKVATQMGNQGHAGEGWRLIYEWIRGGYLGTIREIHSWTDRPNRYWAQAIKRPEGEDPVPAEVDWDKWLGPASPRPYKDKTYHPFVWRGWWDFGCGALGDMACHTMDGLFWAMDPASPTAVEPIAVSEVFPETFPNASMIKWEFPARHNQPPFVAYWYDGGLLPTKPADLEVDRELGPLGNLFIGTKASVLTQGSYGDSVRIYPEKKMREIGKPKQLLPRSPGHYLEWLLAVAGKKPLDYPKSNFGYAGPMTEAILLGNLALKMGRRLEWDGPNLRVTNVPEANQYVSKEYRPGWKF